MLPGLFYIIIQNIQTIQDHCYALWQRCVSQQERTTSLNELYVLLRVSEQIISNDLDVMNGDWEGSYRDRYRKPKTHRQNMLGAGRIVRTSSLRFASS